MEPNDTAQAIELLKAAKNLFDNDYLTAYVGVAGALVGALAGYFPAAIISKQQRNDRAKSTAYQIYAELKAMQTQVQQRGYGKHLGDIAAALEDGSASSGMLVAHFPDDRFVVYRANLCNLGLLPPKMQTKIVMLYQLLESLIQDLKPGGVLNNEHANVRAFKEAVSLYRQAEDLFSEVIEQLEGMYPELIAEAAATQV